MNPDYSRWLKPRESQTQSQTHTEVQVDRQATASLCNCSARQADFQAQVPCYIDVLSTVDYLTSRCQTVAIDSKLELAVAVQMDERRSKAEGVFW